MLLRASEIEPAATGMHNFYDPLLVVLLELCCIACLVGACDRDGVSAEGLHLSLAALHAQASCNNSTQRAIVEFRHHHAPPFPPTFFPSPALRQET